MKQKYHLYQELVDKIEDDKKNKDYLKQIISEQREEIEFLKQLIKNTNITTDKLVDLLIHNTNLKTNQRQFINKLIEKNMEDCND